MLLVGKVGNLRLRKMMPAGELFPQRPNHPVELEDVAVGSGLVNREMTRSSMELDEIPRGRIEESQRIV